MPESPPRRVAAVVLTYRADAAMLRRCVESVVASGDAERVLVVDNGQTVRREVLPPAVELLTTWANLGYAGGMNAGIAHAMAAGVDAVALLNDDTVVEPGWLERCRRRLDDAARIGAVQPKLVLSGTDPPRINSVGVRVRGDGAGIDIGYGEPDTGQFDQRHELEIFTGGAVVLSRAFLVDVGGFDERYFMYYEDIDLALRGHERGWTYRLEPAAVVHHAWSTTAASVPHRRRFWQERNRLWLLARHRPPRDLARGLVLSSARLAKTVALAPRRGLRPVGAQARAIASGVAGVPRRWRERRRPVRFDP